MSLFELKLNKATTDHLIKTIKGADNPFLNQSLIGKIKPVDRSVICKHCEGVFYFKGSCPHCGNSRINRETLRQTF